MRRNAKGLSAHYFLRVDWPSVQYNGVFNYPIARHPSAESGRSESVLHTLVIVLSTNLMRAACDKIVSLARHHGNALFVAAMLYLSLPGRS